MILLVKLNGRYDIEHKRKLYHNLTRHEMIEFLQVAEIPSSELMYMDESYNSHFFGDINGVFLYSKDEPENYLVRRRDERVTQ